MILTLKSSEVNISLSKEKLDGVTFWLFLAAYFEAETKTDQINKIYLGYCIDTTATNVQLI